MTNEDLILELLQGLKAKVESQGAELSAKVESLGIELQNTSAELQNTNAELHSTKAELSIVSNKISAVAEDFVVVKGQVEKIYSKLFTFRGVPLDVQTQVTESQAVATVAALDDMSKNTELEEEFEEIATYPGSPVTLTKSTTCREAIAYRVTKVAEELGLSLDEGEKKSLGQYYSKFMDAILKILNSVCTKDLGGNYPVSTKALANALVEVWATCYYREDSKRRMY